jgi:spore coat polysaccharide biosynthesis protein SpsF
MDMQKKINVVAIIQARMGSSRLPGKVLKPLGERPMLGQVVHRLRPSNLVNRIVVATTIDPSDDEIAQFCSSEGIDCFRGDVFDVLDRYYQAARYYRADVVVRITADCPLMDASLVDEIVAAFFDLKVDFAANRLPPPWKRSYPIGLDIEVVSFSALKRTWQEAQQPFEREHVMPYLYDQSGRFKTLLLHHEPDYGEKRWTVDTPQDLDLLQAIFNYFREVPNFTWEDVLSWVAEHPDIEQMNAGVIHKKVDDVDERFTGKMAV